MDLDSVQILFRQNDTMSLWGLPHGLRPGQSPRDLQEVNNTKGWIWLGTPGWWGSISRSDIEKIRKFLEGVGDMVPFHPGEWSTVDVPVTMG